MTDSEESLDAESEFVDESKFTRRQKMFSSLNRPSPQLMNPAADPCPPGPGGYRDIDPDTPVLKQRNLLPALLAEKLMSNTKPHQPQQSEQMNNKSILQSFPPPPGDGYKTVCEYNGEMVFREEQHVAKGLLQLPIDIQKFIYPTIDVSSCCVKSSLYNKTATAKSAFIEPQGVPLMRRVTVTWFDRGLAGVLEEIVTDKHNVGTVVTAIASNLLAAIRWVSSMHGYLYPHLTMSCVELINEFSPIKYWSQSPVRAMAWHHSCMKLAIAGMDDTVRIHNIHSEPVVTLKHRCQHLVCDLSWRPLSACDLAVACVNGILLWQIDPNSQSTRPSSSNVQLLTYCNHSPVTSLSWSPDGRLLASACPTDTNLMVWDTHFDRQHRLRRFGGGGVSTVHWAPNNEWIFTATPSNVFRVWETQKWTCDKWRNLGGRCQSACWSPDSTVLLFTVTEKPVLYCLTFPETGSVIGQLQAAVEYVDLSEVMMETVDGDVIVGGIVQSMCWDRTGERLAIIFRDNTKTDNTGNYVALFRVRLSPVFDLVPLGFVGGGLDDCPVAISFAQQFEHGALLTVCWQSGTVTFLPLCFTPSTALKLIQHKPVFNITTAAELSDALLTESVLRA